MHQGSRQKRAESLSKLVMACGAIAVSQALSFANPFLDATEKQVGTQDLAQWICLTLSSFGVLAAGWSLRNAAKDEREVPSSATRIP